VLDGQGEAGLTSAPFLRRLSPTRPLQRCGDRTGRHADGELTEDLTGRFASLRAARPDRGAER